MTDILSSDELRRWATDLEGKAEQPECSAEARQRLLKMRESLLALAATSDWLAGECPQH